MTTVADADYIKLIPETSTTLLMAINSGKPITARANAPVPGGAALDDLGVAGPGLLFASGMYLAEVGRLAGQVAADGKNRDWHAAPLLRSLYEYVVTFCWLMADPSGARATNWAAEDKRIRLAVDRELAAVGSARRLPDPTRANFDAAVAAARRLPSLETRAREADAHWEPRLEYFQKHHASTNPGPLTDAYPLIYRNCSSIAHPTPRGLQECFVHPGPGGDFVIGTTRDSSSRFFYTQAPIIFSFGLMVAAEIYPWVDGGSLDAAFASWPR